LNLKNVTSLVVNGRFGYVFRHHLRDLGCWFYILKEKGKLGTLPLLPNLERVKYYICWHESDSDTVENVNLFSEFFLTGVKLTHFEFEFGFSATEPFSRYPYKPRENWAQGRIYELFDQKLRQCDSLQVFVNGNEVKRDPLFSRNGTGQINLRLLVFKCGHELPYSEEAWSHIWAQFTWFKNCDCILLETPPGAFDLRTIWRVWPKHCNTRGKVTDPAWWDWPAHGTINKWRPQGLSLRYFMVGNTDAGYQGIERDMGAPLKESGNFLWWTYKILSEEECAQVLRARCPDL
jgi:hypothetical protein